MHSHGFDDRSRRGWQDPERILKSAGVRRGMTVADLGCGSGFFTIPLGSMVGEAGKVFAVDSRPAAHERLRENLNSVTRSVVRTVQADVSKTSIPSGSVDAAFVSNLLRDIDDKAEFILEVRRMKPTGRLVVVDWRRIEMEFGPPLEIRLDEKSVRETLKAGGFEITDTRKPDPYHYGFVATQMNS